MIHIVGAGIAGLTLAERLQEQGVDFRVYEKEASCGAAASGKNAGIIRSYEVDPSLVPFALESLRYYRTHEPSFDACGLLLRPWEIDYTQKDLQKMKFPHDEREGFFLPENGVIRPQAVLSRLVEKLNSRIQYNSEITPVVRHSKIVALQVATGSAHGGAQHASTELDLAADDQVVYCPGEMPESIHSDLRRVGGQLIAHERTLMIFSNEAHESGPTVWDEEQGVYYRIDGEQVIATSGEQIPVKNQSPSVGDIAALKQKLDTVFPVFRGREILEHRTCRRVSPLDSRPVVGRDRKLENLFWFAGLGGRGMSLTPALSAMLSDEITGARMMPHSLFSPDRFY